MKRSKLILLAAAAAMVGSSGASRTAALSAQEVRCWVVMCTIATNGTMTCVEKPKPCPPEIT